MLIWNGKGFLPGIPARDLDDDEVKEFGGEKKLLASGLYEKEAPPKKRAPKKQTEGETWQE
jgi:hypothetical protein